MKSEKKLMTQPAPAAELAAAVLLDENTVLMLGHDARPLPAHGQISFGVDSTVGSFAAVSWPGEGGRHWFLTRLVVEQVALLALRRSALSADGQEFPLPEISRLALEPQGLADALAGAVGANLPAVVEFLRPNTRILATVLLACAAPDGFIEIFGRAHGDEMYVQGWSASLGIGTADLLIETDRCVANHALVATYGRPDLAAPARGIGLVVTVAEPFESREVRRVYYRNGTGYRRLEVFENRLLFGDAETGGHVAAMLPQLQATPETIAALKRLGAPRFQGGDTLCTLGAPVRAAIDMAAWVPGAGFFLAGWMLDPERLAATVRVGAVNGFRARIDQSWTRSQRPDVSQGYAQDPLFAGRIRAFDDGHGFLVFVPCDIANPGEVYFEVALHDGQSGFMPLRPSQPSAAEVRQILSSFDINHPDIEQIVAAHVGPIVMAAGRGAAPRRRSVGGVSFGTAVESPRLSIVLPVAMGRTDVDVTMARLAVEPAIAGVELVIAASGAAAAAIGPQLQRQARFYGLSGRLVLSDGNDAFQAMAAGADAAAADLLLFLGGAVLPRHTGWLGQLEKLLATNPRAAAISPTLLYEDLSVRFAGARANGWAPPKDAAGLTAYAGYARHWLARDAMRADAAVPVHAVAAECCLIRRTAFDAVGGFSEDLVGPEFKSLDLSLKLRAARQQCLWAPGIEMLAPDEAVGEPEYWARTGALVDRWGFQRKWSQLFAAQGNA